MAATNSFSRNASRARESAGSVAFGHYRDNWVIVQARDVEWRTFMDVVMAYQNRADSNAEARDERFKR